MTETYQLKAHGFAREIVLTINSSSFLRSDGLCEKAEKESYSWKKDVFNAFVKMSAKQTPQITWSLSADGRLNLRKGVGCVLWRFDANS